MLNIRGIERSYRKLSQYGLHGLDRDAEVLLHQQLPHWQRDGGHTGDGACDHGQHVPVQPCKQGNYIFSHNSSLNKNK